MRICEVKSQRIKINNNSAHYYYERDKRNSETDYKEYPGKPAPLR